MSMRAMITDSIDNYHINFIIFVIEKSNNIYFVNTLYN